MCSQSLVQGRSMWTVVWDCFVKVWMKLLGVSRWESHNYSIQWHSRQQVEIFNTRIHFECNVVSTHFWPCPVVLYEQTKQLKDRRWATKHGNTITVRGASVYIGVSTYSWKAVYDSQYPYLVHGEVSVVEVAGASLEADFSHAVVNQEEIPQLWETKSPKLTIKQFACKWAHPCSRHCIEMWLTFLSCCWSGSIVILSALLVS